MAKNVKFAHVRLQYSDGVRELECALRKLRSVRHVVV